MSPEWTEAEIAAARRRLARIVRTWDICWESTRHGTDYNLLEKKTCYDSAFELDGWSPTTGWNFVCGHDSDTLNSNDSIDSDIVHNGKE